MAADLELSLYLSQRSYLNQVSNQPTLDLLGRLLEVEGEPKAKVYRKVAQVYAVDRDYVRALRYLEVAAEHDGQEQENNVAADSLWLEAAQTAVEMEDLGKAHGYLARALAQNPQNRAAQHSCVSYRCSTSPADRVPGVSRELKKSLAGAS